MSIDQFRNTTIHERSSRRLELFTNIPRYRLDVPALDEVFVDDSFIGDGYAIPTRESEEAARLFAETEGILLDPVYTSKAAAGLIAYCREGRFKPTDRVLFWHTGGVLSLL